LQAEKIVVTPEAADEIFGEATKQEISEGREKQILATHGIQKPFILYVGNAFPYKNLDSLLSALAQLDKNIYLVYVGSRNVFVERLIEKAKEKGVDNRLIITGFVPNEDLAVLYQLAEMFVFPSLSEGFGLPGIEAMSAGCPLVCSNIPVFKEIYGEAAVYFDPKKPKDIADKIQFVIHNSEFRIQSIKKGFEQVKKYSWKNLAEQTLEVYKSMG